MNGRKLLQCEDYDPNRFVDWLVKAFDCKNDSALARKIGTDKSYLSRVRNKALPAGDSLLVKASDYTGMSTLAIRCHMFRDEVAR